jgi:hypothetical protein
MIWFPDHTASSELLCWLCYPGVLVGMVWTGENHGTGRKACDSATWTYLGLNWGVCSQRPATDELTTWAMVQPNTFSGLTWDWTWSSAARDQQLTWAMAQLLRHCIWMVKSYVQYSAAPGFKFWPQDQLSHLQFCMVALGSALSYAAAPSTSLIILTFSAVCRQHL